MNKKGFTLFETMVSIAIFSALMAIVFGAWTEFQKTARKHEGKQDTNITFVNVYRSIDKIVSSSSVRLFRSYLDDTPEYLNFGHTNLRWFSFLLSRNNQQLDGRPIYQKRDDTTSDVLIYNTCVVYLLYTPEDSCEGFQNCPHKSLRRYVFGTTQGNNDDEVYFGADENKVLHIYREKIMEGDKAITVRKILDNPNDNSFPYSVIENNIVDLKIDKQDDKIRFFLRILRINDAQRYFEIGTKQLTSSSSNIAQDFTSEDARNYIENLSWISIPNNT